MQTALIILHVLASLTLIILVLLQTGKGSDIGAVFGGSSQTLFGSTGAATFLTKLTTVVAVVFIITSLALYILATY
jgi:preprotein translocase subunit SecG